jgi:hypothetical protein
MAKPLHYQGPYLRTAMRVRQAARANPLTRCWSCSRTLDEHEPHRNGKRPWWTAGHQRDGDPTSPLLPEASTCNLSRGGRLGNQRRAALAAGAAGPSGCW